MWKKKLKKRQDKEEKRIERKANSNKGKSFEEMLAYGSVDFAQPSVTKIGGITEMLKGFATPGGSKK